jgi:hypothetical protein
VLGPCDIDGGSSAGLWGKAVYVYVNVHVNVYVYEERPGLAATWTCSWT